MSSSEAVKKKDETVDLIAVLASIAISSGAAKMTSISISYFDAANCF